MHSATQRRGMLLTLCALSVPIWWIGMFTSESVRNIFAPEHAWVALQRFLVADGFLFLTTLLTAHQVRRGLPAAPYGYLCLGAWCYASAWTCAAAWDGAVRWPAALLMIAGLCLVTTSVGLVSKR